MKSFTDSKSINKKLIKSIFFGVVSGSLITLLLMLLATMALMSAGAMPEYIYTVIVLALLGVGSFFGGYISSRINKAAGIAVGAITGAIIFLIVFLSGFNNFSRFTMMSLYKLCVVMLCSILGGIIGVNKKQKIRFK